MWCHGMNQFSKRSHRTTLRLYECNNDKTNKKRNRIEKPTAPVRGLKWRYVEHAWPKRSKGIGQDVHLKRRYWVLHSDESTGHILQPRFSASKAALFCLFREINRRCIRDPAIYFSYRNGRRTCTADSEAEQNARTLKRVFFPGLSEMDENRSHFIRVMDLTSLAVDANFNRKNDNRIWNGERIAFRIISFISRGIVKTHIRSNNGW